MRIIVVAIFVLLLLGMGGVAVRNFHGEKTLQFIPDLTPEPVSTPTALVIVDSDWQIFQSLDGSFRFRYPLGWQTQPLPLIQKGKGVYGMIVQSWVLASYPSEEVKVEFEISTEGRKQSPANLFDCEGLAGLCQNQEINGVLYKRTTRKGENGALTISLATIKEDRVYRISAVVISQDNPRLKELEQVFGTMEILKIN